MDYKYYYGFLKKEEKEIETNDFKKALKFYNKRMDIFFEMCYKIIRKEELGLEKDKNIIIGKLEQPYIKRSDGMYYHGELFGWWKDK